MKLKAISEDKLIAAFCAARKAAAEADPGEGASMQGACNFDTAVASLKGVPVEMVDRCAEIAGVRVGHFSKWKWFVFVEEGNGFRRTKMAEAASKALNDAGVISYVWYQLD